MDNSTPSARLRIALIVGSARAPRTAGAVLPWLRARLAGIDWLDLDVIDLATVDLPPAELQIGGATTPISAALAAADGFLVLTPEYNHSFPATLKNAIDWHHTEWRFKPVAFVSYGAGSGGIRAIEHLRLVFPELNAMTTRNSVILVSPWEHIAADSTFQPPAATDQALTATLNELRWWTLALRDARSRHPLPV